MIQTQRTDWVREIELYAVVTEITNGNKDSIQVPLIPLYFIQANSEFKQFR